MKLADPPDLEIHLQVRLSKLRLIVTGYHLQVSRLCDTSDKGVESMPLEPAVTMQHGHGSVLPLLLDIKTVFIENSEAPLGIGFESEEFSPISNHSKFLCQDLIETSE